MIKSQLADTLTEKQKESIRRLVDACIAYEELTLSYPELEGEDVLVYQSLPTSRSERPESVLIAYPCGDYTEITAFTHPERRCRGLFTGLFERYLSEHGEEPICFFADGCSYDALMTLEMLECEYTSTEHLMDCDLKSRPLLPFSEDLCLTACDDLALLVPIHSRAFGVPEEESRAFLAKSLEDGAICWLVEKGEQPVGLCLGTAAEETVYLFGFCIDPDYQKQGLGLEALALLLDCLSDAYRSVSIQVSEENTAAYRLYCKAGFAGTQELMEYWY